MLSQFKISKLFEIIFSSYFVFLLPFWLEIYDGKDFYIQLPGLPYTAGTLSLVLFGLFNLNWNTFYSNKIYKSFLIIYFGIFLGSFFGPDIFGSFSRSIGQLLILISLKGVSDKLKYEKFQNVIDILMIGLFVKWTIYVINQTIKGGEIVSYSETFFIENKTVSNLNTGILNHHIPGLFLTISSMYIINRFFFIENGRKILGYLIAIFTIVLVLLLESRSNFLMYILTLLIYFFFTGKFGIKKIVYLTILFMVAYNIIGFYLQDVDFLKQRFDLNDMEYQENSNRARTLLYESYFKTIFTSPLGRGIKNIYVEIEVGKFLVHNQYLTLILAGGIISLYGILKMFSIFFKFIKYIYSNLSTFSQVKSFNKASFFTAILLLLTMLTVEILGGVFTNLLLCLLFFSTQKASD